mgnify:CR=1 FL=1
METTEKAETAGKPFVIPMEEIPPFYLGSLQLPIVAHDHRRTIYELNFPKHSWQGFRIYHPDPLGNHYHLDKAERFHILKGKACLATRRVFPEWRSTGVEVMDVDETTVVIEILPGVAHAFSFIFDNFGEMKDAKSILESAAVMLCWSSAPFDPKKMDMAPWKLL